MSTHLKCFQRLFAAAALLAAAGCSLPSATQSPSPSQSPAQETPSLSVSPTPEATATPSEPLAATVNGEGIFLSDYQAGLKQFQEAAASASPADASKAVLDDLIADVLLAQAAEKAGQTVTSDQVEARITELGQQLGNPAALTDWQAKNGYTDAGLRRALRVSILAAWQRDQLAAAVPETADQVHARQVLFRTQETAESVLQRLKAGEDFATIASEYDPLIGGDLGWFPKGYLTQPEVEKAAFELQPGQYSEIIPTPLGYHIVQVIERDAGHALTPDARRFLQRQAVAQWITEQRQQSQVEILAPGS